MDQRRFNDPAVLQYDGSLRLASILIGTSFLVAKGLDFPLLGHSVRLDPGSRCGLWRKALLDSLGAIEKRPVPANSLEVSRDTYESRTL